MIFALLGAVIVAVTLADAIDTLVSTRIRGGRWWPTEVFYRNAWYRWRWIGLRFRDGRRREVFLSLFGPLSLLVLLAMWVLGQILGWSLIWWSLSDHFATQLESFVSAVYYSGIVYFSVGFGDVLPGDSTTRILALVEAFGGLATMGLVIGFIPTLLGAYQAREAQLFQLDAFGSDRITPVGLMQSYLGEGCDFDDIRAVFGEWERWAAQTTQSLSSFPMLGLFRSQYPGLHWVTALGVVTDAAILSDTMFAQPCREAKALIRRTERLVRSFGERIGASPLDPPAVDQELFSIAYRHAETWNIELLPLETAFERMKAQRRDFAPWMESLIWVLAAPAGFWSHDLSTREIRLGGQDAPTDR